MDISSGLVYHFNPIATEQPLNGVEISNLVPEEVDTALTLALGLPNTVHFSGGKEDILGGFKSDRLLLPVAMLNRQGQNRRGVLIIPRDADLAALERIAGNHGGGKVTSLARLCEETLLALYGMSIDGISTSKINGRDLRFMRFGEPNN